MTGARPHRLALLGLGALLVSGCLVGPAARDRPTTDVACLGPFRSPGDPSLVPRLVERWDRRVPEWAGGGVTPGTFVMAAADKLTAVSTRDGSTRWEQALAETESGPELHTVGLAGILVADRERAQLLSSEGTVLWEDRRPTAWATAGDGLALVADRNLTLLRPDAPRWTEEWTAPAPAGSRGGLVAWDAPRRVVLWLTWGPAESFDAHTPADPPTAQLTAHDGRDGRVLWTTTAPTAEGFPGRYGSMRVIEGRLVLVGDSGEGEKRTWAHFASLDAATGAILGSSQEALGQNWSTVGEPPGFLASEGPEVMFWRHDDETTLKRPRPVSLVVGTVSRAGRFVKDWERPGVLLAGQAASADRSRVYLWDSEMRWEEGEPPAARKTPEDDPDTWRFNRNITFFDRNFVVALDGRTGAALGCATGEWDLKDDGTPRGGAWDYPWAGDGFVDPATGRLVAFLSLRPGPDRLAAFD